MWCCHRRRRRRRRIVRIRRRIAGSRADLRNVARTGAQSAGLLNLNVQIPINLGDATAFNRSNGNSVSNLL